MPPKKRVVRKVVKVKKSVAKRSLPKKAAAKSVSRAASPAPRKPSVARAPSPAAAAAAAAPHAAATRTANPKSPKPKATAAASTAAAPNKKKAASQTTAAAVKVIRAKSASLQQAQNNKKQLSQSTATTRQRSVPGTDPVERLRRQVCRDVLDWAITLASKEDLSALCAAWELPPPPPTTTASANNSNSETAAAAAAQREHLDLLELCSFSRVPQRFIEAFITRNWGFVNLFVAHADWDLLIRIRPPSQQSIDLDYGDRALMEQNRQKLGRGAIRLGAALSADPKKEPAITDDALEREFGESESKIQEWRDEMAAAAAAKKNKKNKKKTTAKK